MALDPERKQAAPVAGEEALIARIWHGVVPTPKAAEYLEKMRSVALPDYEAIEGNRGAWCLQCEKGSLTHFLMVSHWESLDAVRRFAGDDYSFAKYYDFDPQYLIEMEEKVEHYALWSLPHRESVGSPKGNPGQSGRDR